jgi:hypothetical protein
LATSSPATAPRPHGHGGGPIGTIVVVIVGGIVIGGGAALVPVVAHVGEVAVSHAVLCWVVCECVKVRG